MSTIPIHMSQHILKCPICGVLQEADAFRSGGEPKALYFNACHHLIENDPATIYTVMGIEEVHRQRIANKEMPAGDDEYDDDIV